MKRKLISALSMLTICISIAGCSASSVESTLNNTKSNISAEEVEDETIVGNETSIVLGDTIAVEGDGVTLDNNIVTITEPGSYEISGTLSDGQIIVNAGKEDNVEIVLNNVNITCTNSAPIYVMQAKNSYIVLADDSENKVTDGSSYVYEDSSVDEPNSAIFSKDDLIIKGNGALTVNANYKHGIVSKDDLKIKSGSVSVNSVGDGLKGKDSVTIVDGNITINSDGDGIQASNTTDAEKGFVLIKGGILNIASGLDGIQAETDVLVSDGDITITSGGGSVNSSKSTEINNTWGNWGAMKGDMNVDKSQFMQENMNRDKGQFMQENEKTDTASDTPSAKAIKAVNNVTIDGGNIKIDSSDDSIHSNGSLVVNSGSISITSGDDGLHADSTLDINGGDVNITKSYEGIESQTITINDGKISVVSSDDGINAGGGNDGSAVNGRPGQNSFESSGNASININGGNISVDATGDGLDANGSIYMKDGTVIVNGPEGTGNGALDYDGSFEASGGLLIAAGSNGMVQAPSTSSSQNSLSIFTSQSADTLIHVESESGEEVITFAPSKNYGSVVICSPNLKTGSTYKVLTGGTSTGTESNGLYNGGKYSGGTEVGSTTISSAVSQIGTGGSNGMMGGKGNRPSR